MELIKKKLDLEICLDDQKVHYVNEIKLLGVILDNNLSWKKQIKYVENKISKGIGILYKMKPKLNSDALLMLYSTLILPYINYCIEIWGNTYETYLEPLIKLQKRALRIVSGLKYRDHTNETFAKFKCLKLKDIILHKSCIQVFKAKQGSLPKNLQIRFQKVNEIHSHSTRNSSNMFQKLYKQHCKSMCLSVKGTSLFNALPTNVKCSKNTYCFKNKLKSMLLRNY